MNRWKFVFFHPSEEDETLPQTFTGTALKVMRQLAEIQGRRGWTLVAATNGLPVQEPLNEQWHIRDVRKRTDARGWILEASRLAPGTLETSSRNGIRRALEHDKRGIVAVMVWSERGDLVQIVLRAREKTSANPLEVG